MSAIRSHHGRLFISMMAEHRGKLVEAMATGTAVDYAAYQQMVGRINGLDEALRISEAADFKLNGEEPSVSS